MTRWTDWRHCLILKGDDTLTLRDISYILRQEEFLSRQRTPAKKFYGLQAGLSCLEEC